MNHMLRMMMCALVPICKQASCHDGGRQIFGQGQDEHRDRDMGGWNTRLAAENRKNVMPMRIGASFSWAATGAPVASSAPAAATNASIASLQAV